jgi:hypothetical protein
MCGSTQIGRRSPRLQERQLLIITLDFLGVVNAINEDPSMGEHCMILKEIGIHRLKFRVAMFSHERRGANKEARSLAPLASTIDVGRHVWSVNPPPDLNVLVNILSNN